MTGFLCALGGVCLSQRSKPCGPTTYSPPMGPMSERKYSMVSVGVCEVSAAGASATCSSSSSTETPLGRFPDRLLVLLVCGHERVGLHVRTNIKELLGLELSPVLYHMLFNKLRNSIGSFFDTQATRCLRQHVACHPDENQAVPAGGGDDGETRRPVLLPGDEVQVSDRDGTPSWTDLNSSLTLAKLAKCYLKLQSAVQTIFKKLDWSGEILPLPNSQTEL